jgi:MSHA biogenesis protein MshM
LEKRTLVLVVDEAQNLSDENLEALRLLLNYHVPQRKLLNMVLFGQPELEQRIAGKGNLSDRVDDWIRLSVLDDAMAAAVLDYRLQRAGMPPGQQLFTPEARSLTLAGAAGIPRRLTMLAHSAMEEASDRGGTLVTEDHVRTAMFARGIAIVPKPAQPPPARTSNVDRIPQGRNFITRLFPRRPSGA